MKNVYRHFKGGLYQVIGRATHTETLEDMVVYKSLETGKMWVRPAEMFFGYIETEQYKGFRFTAVNEE